MARRRSDRWPIYRSSHRRFDASGCSDSARRRSRRSAVRSRFVLSLTLLRPICRTRPCCWSVASTVSPDSIISSARATSSNMLRRLTTSRTSTPKFRRLSCTAWSSSPGDDAARTDPSLPRRAPILVTMTRSSGVWMQRLTNQLVRDVRAIVVAGVDVVYSRRQRLHATRLRRHSDPAVVQRCWCQRGALHRSRAASLDGRRAGTYRTAQRRA